MCWTTTVPLSSGQKTQFESCPFGVTTWHVQKIWSQKSDQSSSTDNFVTTSVWLKKIKSVVKEDMTEAVYLAWLQDIQDIEIET